LLFAANVVPNSPIFVNLMMEALSSLETSIRTRPTLRNIPQDAILHSHRRENLKSYNVIPQVSHWRNPSSRTMFLRYIETLTINEYQEISLG
jgi:hypothetical protein